MKNIKLIFVIFIGSLLFASCGYKVLNQKNLTKIKSYELNGDEKILRKLSRNFDRFKEIKDFNKTILIDGSAEISKITASKDSAGEDLSYKITIKITLNIREEGSSSLEEKTFQRDTQYNNLNSKFELKQLEKIRTEELIEEIINEINNYLNNFR